ncbi:NRDE protein-domain-containing protein [Mycena sanguinolenta]|nr:NRDE protein-domain-containing protein [Mycena sanguinolenta]
MCVAFWTLDHPDYALILCNNRDEFLARPALAAAFHSFQDAHSNVASDSHFKPNLAATMVAEYPVLSARDSQAGGTWFGLAPQSGRIALLTNISEPHQALPSSRGTLPSAFLLAQRPCTPLDEMFPQAAYAGFNLLLLEAEWEALTVPAAPRVHFPHAALLSNGGAGGQLQSRPLRADERVSGGLSNGLFVGGAGGEAWPKVVQGRALFAEALKAHDAEAKGHAEDAADAALAGRLFALLRTTAAKPIRAREDLRRTICVKPLDTTAAGPSGSSKWYGTRTASVLLVRRSGAALFVERDVWRIQPGGDVELYAGGEVGGRGTQSAGDGERPGERVFRIRVGAGAPA